MTRLVNKPWNPFISVKEGVELDTLRPPLRNRLVDLSYLWKAFFPGDLDGLTITSTNDGQHMAGSKHYTDDAIDLRVRDVDVRRCRDRVVPAMKHLLGEDYDVVFEGDHLHVEYDPADPHLRPGISVASVPSGTPPGTGG